MAKPPLYKTRNKWSIKGESLGFDVHTFRQQNHIYTVVFLGWEVGLKKVDTEVSGLHPLSWAFSDVLDAAKLLWHQSGWD